MPGRPRRRRSPGYSSCRSRTWRAASSTGACSARACRSRRRRTRSTTTWSGARRPGWWSRYSSGSRPCSRARSALPERCPSACCLDVLVDRNVNEIAPLGPRAVVVLDVVVPEELVQHEPGVRRALADPAVGDDLVPVQDALAGVELAELVGGLEGAVLLHSLSPRHGCRARDVP